jgi:uncharacterized protein YbcI
MPDQAVTDEQRRARGQASSAISTGAVKLVNEYTGRGPTKAHTIINRDSVAIVLQDTLTKGERSLVAAGQGPDVLAMRRSFQEVMREELVALVESHVHRKVIAFLSDNHFNPDVAVEFFLLEPTADGASAA